MRLEALQKKPNIQVLLLGTGLIVAAIVGGGLKGAGFEIPVFQSVPLQISVAAIGVLLFILSFWAGEPLGSQAIADKATDPARTIATSPSISHQQVEQAEQQDEKVYVGKARDFVILDPRPQWTLEWMSVHDLLTEQGLTDQDILQTVHNSLTAIDPTDPNILRIQSKVFYNVQGTPGVTQLNGVPLLFSLGTAPFAPKVQIASYNKFASMQVDRQPLWAFAVEQLVGLQAMKVIVTDVRKEQRKDGKPAVVIESEQRLDNVQVNGVADQSIVIKNNIVAIEGAVRNYAVILAYIEGSAVASSDEEHLRKISKSFILGDPDDPGEAVILAQKEGQSRRQTYIHRNKEEIALQNYYLLLLKLSNRDLSEEDSIQYAIAEVGTFLDFLESIEVDLSYHEDLMAARDEALHGDTHDFVEMLEDEITEMINRG
jgi:hypothetical protein